MRQHHNVLYVTTPETYLHKRDAAVEVVRDGQAPTRVPLHHLQSIVCFGPVTASPWLMAACAEAGIAISFLTAEGRFLAQVVGPQQGNVLLRRAQYRAADDPSKRIAVARAIVLAKVANSRTLLRRGGREAGDTTSAEPFSEAAERVTVLLEKIKACDDLDSLRGLEGAAATLHFGCFSRFLRGDLCFAWSGRNSRPPRDPANAALSFLYSILATDCGAAAQAVGLDPQVGFLHVEKSGRPALALDMMEEFRPLLADRLLFAMVNRKQLQEKHFERQEGGAVLLTAEGRKALLVQYQERKREEIRHPFTEEVTTYGLLPHLQARLLARHLRGDLDGYPPFLAS
ncbi:MAG: type I-C CRISPR-associated endonuclease Cas1c [Minicystis sp.]